MPWGTRHSRVPHAMRAVRRELFVPAKEREHAHADTALPIGHAQTISQPSLVARMTEQLALTVASRVLEIGTGSGFQTAILAELAAAVFTIERIPALAESARVRLVSLGYRNIEFRTGDGAVGWPEAAPFDAIVVTAAAPMLPVALVAQLHPGGRMVIPLGNAAGDDQVLFLVTKDAHGAVIQTPLCDVRFVPFISTAFGEPKL